MNRTARYQPATRSFAVMCWDTSSLRRVRQELHEGGELFGLERTRVVRGHDPHRVALRDLGVGPRDRLLDERRVLALEDLVEVRAGRAGRVRLFQRVAGAAGGRARAVAVGEQRLAVRSRARLAAATARAATARGALTARPPDPGVERRAAHHVGGLAHEGVPEPAQ